MLTAKVQKILPFIKTNLVTLSARSHLFFISESNCESGCEDECVFGYFDFHGFLVCCLFLKAENGIFEDLKCCFFMYRCRWNEYFKSICLDYKKNDGRVRLACINDKEKKVFFANVIRVLC